MLPPRRLGQRRPPYPDEGYWGGRPPRWRGSRWARAAARRSPTIGGSTTERRMNRRRGQWMDTGHTLTTLQPGQTKRFRAGAVEGFVVHPESGGAIYAVSAACTHMGCAISWMAASDTFLCPCHGAQYNADGTVLSGIARHPL